MSSILNSISDLVFNPAEDGAAPLGKYFQKCENCALAVISYYFPISLVIRLFVESQPRETFISNKNKDYFIL